MLCVMRPHRRIVSLPHRLVVKLNARFERKGGSPMATIGFIGLGNMGAPMAANLVKAQHHVTGYDVVAPPIAALAEKGGHGAASAAEAAVAGDIVITMLPSGPQGRAAYLGPAGITAQATPAALLVHCSAVD